MIEHDEQELLSAFIDGELDEADRASVEAHLASCPSCREIESALGATVEDLAVLPAVEPSPQDQWALRAAINRARTAKSSRWQRWAAGSSAAAAALALIVSFTVLGGDGQQSADTAGAPEEAAIAMDEGGVPIEVIEEPFDEASARSLLDTRATDDGAAEIAAAHQRSVTRDAERADGSVVDEIRTCEADLFSGERTERIPIRYIAAPYRDTPALFLIYELPDLDHIEMWVVARGACSNVLLFEQRAR